MLNPKKISTKLGHGKPKPSPSTAQHKWCGFQKERERERERERVEGQGTWYLNIQHDLVFHESRSITGSPLIRIKAWLKVAYRFMHIHTHSRYSDSDPSQ
jgi:hypothetical protein